MAATITITLDREVALPPVPKNATGKSLAREADKLDFLARSAGVPQLSSMLSERRADLLAQLTADGFDVSKMRLPAETFHPPADGLNSVAAIIAHVSAKPNDVKQPGAILRDLKAVEAILTAAARAGAQFHFTRAEAAG